jgi:starch phosphorylase
MPGPAAESWLQRGASPAELSWINEVLDPDVLTIGFARRVPTYKRLTLMLRDPERLKRCCWTRSGRCSWSSPASRIRRRRRQAPHPGDGAVRRRPEVRHRIVFLPDYDMGMAEVLYPGCDVWLNNPLRPLEACGTSGMKAALNGGLNLSDPRRLVGRVVRRRERLGDPDRRRGRGPRSPRRHRGQALYDLIEDSVAAAFYDRDEDGLPARWIEMVRARCSSPGPRCSPRGWCATTCRSCTDQLRCRRSRPLPTTTRWPRISPAGSTRCARCGRRCRSNTSRPGASATSPRSATRCASRCTPRSVD